MDGPQVQWLFPFAAELFFEGLEQRTTTTIEIRALLRSDHCNYALF